MLVFDINLCGINEKALLATSGISDPSLRMMSIARIQCSDSIKKFGVVGFDLLTQTADGQFLSASLFVTDGNRDVMKRLLVNYSNGSTLSVIAFPWKQEA